MQSVILVYKYLKKTLTLLYYLTIKDEENVFKKDWIFEK